MPPPGRRSVSRARSDSAELVAADEVVDSAAGGGAGGRPGGEDDEDEGEVEGDGMEEAGKGTGAVSRRLEKVKLDQM